MKSKGQLAQGRVSFPFKDITNKNCFCDFLPMDAVCCEAKVNLETIDKRHSIYRCPIEDWSI